MLHPLEWDDEEGNTERIEIPEPVVQTLRGFSPRITILGIPDGDMEPTVKEAPEDDVECEEAHDEEARDDETPQDARPASRVKTLRPSAPQALPSDTAVTSAPVDGLEWDDDESRTPQSSLYPGHPSWDDDRTIPMRAEPIITMARQLVAARVAGEDTEPLPSAHSQSYAPIADRPQAEPTLVADTPPPPPNDTLIDAGPPSEVDVDLEDVPSRAEAAPASEAPSDRGSQERLRVDRRSTLESARPIQLFEPTPVTLDPAPPAAATPWPTAAGSDAGGPPSLPQTNRPANERPPAFGGSVPWDRSAFATPRSVGALAPVPPPPPPRVEDPIVVRGSARPFAPAVEVPAAPPAYLSTVPPMAMPPGALTPPRSDGRWSKVGAVSSVVALLTVVAVALFVVWPRTGQLRVELELPAGVVVPKAEIFVDGQKRCDTHPCVVAGLASGEHLVKVLVPGAGAPLHATAQVVAGELRPITVTLGALPAQGLRASTAQSDVRVYVDGVARGKLPVELGDLTTGKHQVRFEGGARYAPLERSVDVPVGKIVDLGSIALEPRRAKLTIELVTKDVRVVLLDDKGDIQELAGPWPRDLDLAFGRYKLVATKLGYAPLTRRFTLSKDNADEKVSVALSPGRPGSESSESEPAPKPETPPATPEEASPRAEESPGDISIPVVPLDEE
jgi:serine/threonine-protein kinase